MAHPASRTIDTATAGPNRRQLLLTSALGTAMWTASAGAHAQQGPASVATTSPSRAPLPPGGNTILITGGGTGIGRALAERLHALGNTVIIASRRTALLKEVASGFRDMHAMTLDQRDPESVRRLADEIVKVHSGLNVVINNAGVQRRESMLNMKVADSADQVETNLNGPIRVTAALLAHLVSRPRARIVNVSSGLAFVPRASFATYSATKAGIHSYTQSLRHQLRNTAVDVIELAPPPVRTEITPGQSRIQAYMPLEDFIEEAISIYLRNPTPNEIIVQRARVTRNAEAEGRYEAALAAVNGMDA
jgi:uncharacterized oxidoreductase